MDHLLDFVKIFLEVRDILAFLDKVWPALAKTGIYGVFGHFLAFQSEITIDRHK